MTDIADIITEVRANLNEDSTVTESFYTDAELINYIKRSINDLCIDTDTNYAIYELAITGSSVGSASITASTTLNFYVATHGLNTRDKIYISGVTGTISGVIENTYQLITKVDDDNFTVAVDGSDYTATSGGVIKMPQNYAFTSISASSTIPLVDLKFMAYRRNDWAEWIYDDLPKTSPKQNVSYTSPDTRRQSCVVYRDTIFLATGPEIDDKIIVAGRWLPTAITTSTDTYPLGAIEEDASIKYVTSMGWLKKNKLEAGAAWMGLYLSRKEDIQKKQARKVALTFPSTLSVVKNTSDYLNYAFKLNLEIPNG